MHDDVAGVLAGAAQWAVVQGDVLEWLAALPADSVDLIVTSPPYERARLYLESGWEGGDPGCAHEVIPGPVTGKYGVCRCGARLAPRDLSVARGTEEWVAWMVEVCRAARRVCKGLCAFVVEGQTAGYRYTASPFLLAADLHRAGFCLRKPPVYRRVGIPGSGGPDWLRNDYEPVICFTRGGKLPWSDNTACGHPPKWAPGGEMSHRLSDGTRRNQWGWNATSTDRKPDGSMVQEGESGGELVTNADPWGKRGRGNNLRGRNADGSKKLGTGKGVKRGATCGYKDGDCLNDGVYEPPAIANPGNVIDLKVGGNQMGARLAHENEAPYPEDLAAFFVRSFAAPGSVVLDPFSGSGTTGAVCVEWGRRFVGCDLRPSQVALSRKRIAAVTPPIPGLLPAAPGPAAGGAGDRPGPGGGPVP